MTKLQGDDVGRFRVTVVVPTFERRELVLACMNSLGLQVFDQNFEVIVVVDGSTDGTAQALRGLRPSFPLLVLEQSNQGAAIARNRGAAAARGEILLFLDDDMEADPQLLAEHDRSHREGADAVLGHLPLHSDSPPSVLRRGVARWADERLRRLSSPHAEIPLDELVTGQCSVRKAIFDEVEGFDLAFSRGGTFGNEDVDLGYRISSRGYWIVFNPCAISRQRYVVTPRQALSRSRQAGHADVAFARKHPEVGDRIFRVNGAIQKIRCAICLALSAGRPVATPISSALRWFTVTLVEHGARGPIAERLFNQVRWVEYWRGVYEAGGFPHKRKLRVLAYHSIRDLAGTPVVESYGIHVDQFRSNLDILQQFGFHFLSADEVVRFLQGRAGLPRRAVLLTFDDCYEDLLHAALPVLDQYGIPAVAFAVSGHVGDSNRWDEAIGAPRLRLLDAKGLQELARRGVEIGAHSCTHRRLTGLSDAELVAEIEGSMNALEAIGLRRPRLFAYPHGACDARVERAAQMAGLLAAFTVNPGHVQSGNAPHRLPRIEILRNDTGVRFLLKVFLAKPLPVGLWLKWRAKLGRLWRRLRGA